MHNLNDSRIEEVTIFMYLLPSNKNGGKKGKEKDKRLLSRIAIEPLLLTVMDPHLRYFVLSTPASLLTVYKSQKHSKCEAAIHHPLLSAEISSKVG